MGINRHSSLLKELGIEEVDITADELRGPDPVCRIAVDISIIYQQCWGNTKSEFSKRPNFYQKEENYQEDMLFSAVRRVYTRVREMVLAGIFPIFVADGKAPDDKKYKRARSEKSYARLEERYAAVMAKIQAAHDASRAPDDATIKEFVKVYNQRPNKPKELDQQVFDVVKNLGLVIVQAPDEADPFCVFLEKCGIVHGVLSTDSDVLVHGARRRLTSFSTRTILEADGNVGTMTVFTGVVLEDILVKGGLTYEQYRDICIMSQCDYNDNIKGIGILTLYKKMIEHGSTEALLASLPPSKDRSVVRLERCRELFGPRGYSLDDYSFTINTEALQLGMPLISHIASIDELERLSIRINDLALKAEPVIDIGALSIT